MITFDVMDGAGVSKKIEVPEEISLNLMEVLKASEYNILATCGGMALCATCQIEVRHGLEKLPPPGEAEIDMLDQLPVCTPQSRLACQIKISDNLEGAVIHLKSA